MAQTTSQNTPQSSHRILRPVSMICSVVAALCLLGCEFNDDVGTDPADTTLTLFPANVTLDLPSSTNVVFTVSDGTAPYAWALSDTNGTYGVISSHDDTAIYTPTAVPGGVYLTATDLNGLSVTATIVQN